MPLPSRLKISISGNSDQAFSVALRFLPAGAPAWQGPWQGVASFDLPALRGLEGDMDAYGLRLSECLFADPNLREAFNGAWAIAMSHLSHVLRLQLEIDPKLANLHGLRWESLRHPIDTDTRLCASQRVHFSRLLHSQDWRTVSLVERGKLEAIVLAANPSGLSEYNLAPINPHRELERARGALSGLAVHELPGAAGLPTLEGLVTAIKDVGRRGKACLVYLICHGTLTSGEAYLWMEDIAGGLNRVSGDDLVAAFKGLARSPLLVVLVSCESAADSEGNAFSALGPRLFESGVPAVLAMQGLISMGTAWKFLPAFLEELLEDGNLERAAAWARWRVRERQDWWSPALLSRLEEGSIYALEDSTAAYRPPPLPEIDQLQDLDGLPPGSYVPHHRNQVFTGREEDLRALAQALLYGDKPGKAVGIVGTPRAAAATGLGGIGKTQLAVEFCYRYGAYFHGVHWVPAGGDIRAGVANCGEKMGLEPWPDEREEQVRLTLRTWQEEGARLVVFDDVQDSEVVAEWLPQLGNVRLLVTSRWTDWPGDLPLEQLPLDMLPLDESLLLLRRLAKRLEQVEDHSIVTLAERLYRLPLALDLAGRYLKERNSLAVEDYLSELSRQQGLIGHSSLLDWTKYNPTDHETNLAATFIMSWKQLDGRRSLDQLAKRSFLAAGYCASGEPIPDIVLILAAGAQNENRFARAQLGIQRLYKLGLLEPGEAGANIHPLLAEFARSLDAEQEQNALLSLAEELTRLANEANKKEDPPPYLPLRAHVQATAAWAEEANLEIAANLWNSLGYFLRMMAEFALARMAYEHALTIFENHLGLEHPKVAVATNNLGQVLQNLGDLQGARAAFERALEINEQVYGLDHPDVASNINNLGSVLHELGDLRGARSALERALAITKQVYGWEHPAVATTVGNLGLVLQDLGDLAAALDAFEYALAIDEKAYGSTHPAVATDFNNLGRVLQVIGDLPGAQAALEKALAINELVYGPEHPEVALVANNLGTVLQDLGDLPEARLAFERALAIDEQAYGLEHPTVAIDLNNLGLILQSQGDLMGAKLNLERALAIWEQSFGSEHPQVAKAINNLGSVLQAQGDLEMARAAFERALAIAEQVYGQENPSVALVLNNLGGVLLYLGELATTRAAFERALAIDESVYGLDHPIVARDVNNLGLVLWAQGDLAGARVAFERAVAILEVRLPVDHPDIRIARYNLEAIIQNSK